MIPMLNHKGTENIETQRLILRRYTLSDAEPMFRNWANDDEVSKYMRWSTHKNIDETKGIVTEWLKEYNAPTKYHWVITLKESGEPIGSITAFSISELDLRCELGYCIGRGFWRNGYTAEAVKAVIHYLLFDVGFNRVEAFHSVNNPASGRVMQKAGMVYEGMAKQKYRCRLGFQDSNLYGIVKSDLYRPADDFRFLDSGELNDGEIELICTAKNPAIPEKQYVPDYVFEIRKDGGKAGEIRLRVGFTAALYCGGQIGYEVDEAYRGSGYAARACRLLAPFAARHGYRKMLISNAPENKASRRTCENIGAKLVRIIDVPQWHQLYEMGRRKECIWEWIPEV